MNLGINNTNLDHIHNVHDRYVNKQSQNKHKKIGKYLQRGRKHI